MTERSSELDVATRAARAGAEVVMQYFKKGVAIRSKGPGNLVSDADIEAEKAIVSVIHASYGDHAVLGEESHQADVAAEHLWIVDPLDGTNNFAHGVPHFGVSVAYYRQGKAECGVVVDPIRDDWYTTTNGGGSYLNGCRVHVSDETRLDQILVGVGFHYDRGEMMVGTLSAIQELFGAGIHGIRRFATASIDLCQVGCGGFGAFFEYELSPWDFAAGRLFVEEAGGRVTTCRGVTLPLALGSILATNGHVHDPMLEVVQNHLPAAY